MNAASIRLDLQGAVNLWKAGNEADAITELAATVNRVSIEAARDFDRVDNLLADARPVQASRRDLFAAAALQGMLAGKDAKNMALKCQAEGKTLANAAFGWADLMCKFSPIAPQKGPSV